METATGLIRPLTRVHAGLLPAEIQRQITAEQGAGLAFGKRDYRIINARVQTLQVGATTSGTVMVGGVGRSLGAHWGAFGGLGSINQHTLSQFRTDVQLKLEDTDSAEKAFLETSLPFQITLSLDPGETLSVFFARGGLPTPRTAGDFRLDDWSPFVAQNHDTGQIVPLCPLPSLLPSKTGGIGCGVALLIFGGIGVFQALCGPSRFDLPSTVFVSGLFFFLPGLFLAVLRPASSRRSWQQDFEAARQFAASTHV
jgi:hypothetical protein